MDNVTRIYQRKQHRRPHYIAEWADRRGMRQSDLADEIGADKSVVSRWYSGSTPGAEWQGKLAAALGIDAESLFRHPDDDWIARFLRGRTDDEIARIKATLEAAFPRKAG